MKNHQALAEKIIFGVAILGITATGIYFLLTKEPAALSTAPANNQNSGVNTHVEPAPHPTQTLVPESGKPKPY